MWLHVLIYQLNKYQWLKQDTKYLLHKPDIPTVFGFVSFTIYTEVFKT